MVRAIWAPSGTLVGAMGQSLRKSTFQARAVGAVVFALVSGLAPGCGYRSNFFTASESAVPFEVSPVPDGVVWARESVHAIAWDGAPFPPEETGSFAVSRDGGATYAEVAFVQARAGRYLYAVPADGEPRLRLRLTVGRVSRETRDVALVASQRRAYRANRVLAEAPFGPRDGAGALVHRDRMWLIGGWNPERFPRSTANDVWSSEDGVAWREEKPNTFLTADFDATADWEGRHLAGYEVMDDAMWILGGDPLQGRYQRDVWRSSDGKRWARVTDAAGFGARALHMSAHFGGRLWVMGGQRIEQFVVPRPGEDISAALFGDVWSSRDGAAWQRVEPVGPSWEPRSFVGNTAVHAGRLWVVGGGSYEDPPAGRNAREFRADAWSTADGAAWTKAREAPPFAPRQSHNVVAFDGRLWVIAGYEPSGNLGDFWYTADGENWYEQKVPGFVERHAACVWAHRGALFVGSGNAIDGKVFRADVFRIEPAP